MGKIKKLSNDVINSIAAGEVVERPSSALKEIIENSIDANATSIDVDVRGSGENLIKVIDNGEGIEKDDIPLAFERHATSKIKSILDLATVNTLGFRGEALPSIASVSRFTLKSKTKNSDIGYMLTVEYGKVGKLKPISMNNGTIIEIKDLFSNVPVRKSFLKSPSTEYYHCEETFIRYAMVNYDIDMKLFHDNTIRYSLKKSDLEKRLYDIFPDMKGKLLYCEGEGKGFSFKIYLSDLHYLYKRSKKHYMFVNKRPFWDKFVYRAIYAGYGNALQGKHPFFSIYIDIDPMVIDVNVHPRKWEIRFSNGDDLFNSIKESVSSLWKESISISNSYNGSNTRNYNYDYKNYNYRDRDYTYVKEETKPIQTSFTFSDTMAINISENDKKDSSKNRKYLQILDTYIVFASFSGMIVIDQHAAGERIMYEKLINNIKGDSQPLLFPIQVHLSLYEDENYKKMKDILHKMGFRINRLGNRIYVIEGVPAGSMDISAESFVDMLQEDLPTEDLYDEVMKRIACNMAIKAGHKMTEEEMENLVIDLFACDNPYFCPHGRPTIIEWKGEEIERWFKRR